MRERTFVHIFCSPSYRAGTTTAARLFADYQIVNQRAFKGFDTDPHDSAFARYFPKQAKVVDLNSIQGQIALFDTLLQPDRIPKIVDVWSRTWRQFSQLALETGFFEEARRRDVTPVIFYCAVPGAASLSEAQRIAEQWPQVTLLVVNNEGAAPLGEHALDLLAKYPAQRQIEIRALDPLVRDIIDDPHFSFAQFLHQPPRELSIVVRAGLRAWLTPVFQQFQSFEMGIALEDAQYFG